MSHRGFQPPSDEAPADDKWDDQSQWNVPDTDWDESWTRKEWNDDTDGESRGNGRSRHPSAQGKRPRSRRGRKGTRDGWGSY